MEESIFRKKSLERISSPEALSDYLRVTSPSVWLILAAVILLLAGMLIWSSTASIDSFAVGTAQVEKGEMRIRFDDEQIARNVQSGMSVVVGETESCYHAGPAAPSCLLVSLFLLADLFRNTVKNRRIIRKRGLWIPSFVLLMILFSIYLDYNIKEGQVSISCLTIAITVGSVFYYIWLHQQFVQKHEQDMMAAQRIRIMMSQIQPHFLYNTIATFKALAGKNPEKAEEVAEKFSVYLRQNLDSLSIDGCIPFEKELEHTRTYAEIEMVRFENVRVEFDLQDLDFGVPPLSLQPLVENAIRHGVRIREEGIVRVSTRRTADGHEIVVADNGEGFDTRVIEEAAGKHIGIRNVRERIETMCGGTLQIDSKCGEGTTVTIRIPAKEAAA